MRVRMFGRGHVTDVHPKKRELSDIPYKIASFRRGGFGDGLLESCLLTAIKRRFPKSSIDGFADPDFFEVVKNHPSCSSIVNVPWGRGMDTEMNVRRKNVGGYDLWYDAKPLPMLDGKMANSYCDLELKNRLEEMERRYYRFNGDEIVSLYQELGCHGQMDMYSKLFGLDVRIQDAFIQRLPLPPNVSLSSSYATISTGFTRISEFKSWPVDRWEIFGKWLNSLGICPVQVGAPSEKKIEGFTSLTNLQMHQQFEVMAGAKFHIGSDGFLCHVSSALGIPTAVLWGPTPSCVWGHPGQVDITSPSHRNVWWTHYRWGRDEECQRMMEDIDPEMVTVKVGKMIENTSSNSSFSGVDSCIVGLVQGGFGDGLMSMSKLKSLATPQKRTIVIVVPDGNGNLENVKKVCEMFSFVDDVIVYRGHNHNLNMARERISELHGNRYRIDGFFDLRYFRIGLIPEPFQKLSLSDLREIPSLPTWIPKGERCCLQPATRQHKGENAVFEYDETMQMIENEMKIPVILVGGPMDVQHVTSLPSKGVDAVGKLTFEETLVLVATSSVSVSMDSWVSIAATLFDKAGVYISENYTLRNFPELVIENGGEEVDKSANASEICEMMKRSLSKKNVKYEYVENPITVRGGTLDRYIYDEVITNNSYHLNDRMKDAVVVDVGSHIGFFCDLCLSKGAAFVDAYEANPRNFAIGSERMRTVPKSVLRYRNFAVWPGLDDFIEFLIDDGINTGSGSVMLDGENKIRVPSISLDRIIKEIGKPIDLLKLDCEGAEYPILYQSDLSMVKNIVGEFHAFGLPDEQEDRRIGNIRSFFSEMKTDAEHLMRHLRDNGFRIHCEYKEAGLFAATREEDPPLDIEFS